MIERPTKRKAYRKMKAEVYRKNKQDSNLERAARNNTCKYNIFFFQIQCQFSMYCAEGTVSLTRH